MFMFGLLEKNSHFGEANSKHFPCWLTKPLQKENNKKGTMAAYEIEIILNRQLADCLSIPVFITDTEGNLIFYNEPAEDILGKRFEDTGEMPVEQWANDFQPIDDDGTALPPEELPLVKTLKYATPFHKSFNIQSMQGQAQKISVTSYPIIGRTGLMLGAVAIFWKS